VPVSWISLQHAPTSEPGSAYFRKAFWAEIAHAENLKSDNFGIVARVYVFAKVIEILPQLLYTKEVFGWAIFHRK
jgi:hypothetical protein